MIACCVSLLGQLSYAAGIDVFEVLFVNPRDGYAVISGGHKHGLAAGDEICIFREDDDEEPVGCGPLSKVRKSVSVVLIGKKSASLIEVGMLTQPSSVIAALREQSKLEPKAEETIVPEQDQDEDIADFGSEKEAKPERKNNTKSSSLPRKIEVVSPSTQGFFAMDYHYVPMLPIQVTIPTFDVDARYQQTGSLWKADRHIKSSLGQLQLSLGSPLGTEAMGRIRMGYAWIPTDALNADFDPSSEQVYFRGKFSARLYSMGLDVVSPILVVEKNRLEWSAGIVINRAEVSFVGTSKDDRDGSSQDLLRYESTLLTTELRGGVAWLWKLSKWHMGLSAELGLPAFALKTKKHFKHELPETVAEDQRNSSKKDLENTMNLKQAPISFLIGIQSRYTW